jgi:hypothetical protein
MGDYDIYEESVLAQEELTSALATIRSFLQSGDAESAIAICELDETFGAICESEDAVADYPSLPAGRLPKRLSLIEIARAMQDLKREAERMYDAPTVKCGLAVLALMASTQHPDLADLVVGELDSVKGISLAEHIWTAQKAVGMTARQISNANYDVEDVPVTPLYGFKQTREGDDAQWLPLHAPVEGGELLLSYTGFLRSQPDKGVASQRFIKNQGFAELLFETMWEMLAKTHPRPQHIPGCLRILGFKTLGQIRKVPGLTLAVQILTIRGKPYWRTWFNLAPM